MIFGGVVNTIGWSLLFLGLLISGALSFNIDLATPAALGENSQTTNGVLSGVLETNYSVGGDEDTEGTPVFAYVFEFEFQDQTFVDTSYATGWVASEGETVVVEFAPDDPQYARIVGMRANPFGRWVLLSLLFPLAGLPLVGWGMRRGLMANRLLRHGRVTGGQLVDKKATSTTVNDRPVFAYVFRFQDDQDRAHRVTMRTSMTWRVEDDVSEPIVYDPMRPERALLVDSLTGHPTITPDGSFSLDRTGPARASLILPVLTALTVAGFGIAMRLL
jgi:hypothetical protein